MAGLQDIPVDDGEMLARFITEKKFLYFDGKRRPTVDPRIFVPFKHIEMSVTRHRDLTERRLWDAGKCVVSCKNRGLTKNNRIPDARLLARADLKASVVREHALKASPSEGRAADGSWLGARNHCNICGYPPKKEDQLEIARRLAEKVIIVDYEPEKLAAYEPVVAIPQKPVAIEGSDRLLWKLALATLFIAATATFMSRGMDLAAVLTGTAFFLALLACRVLAGKKR